MNFIIKCEAIGYFVYLEYKASTKEDALLKHKSLYGTLKDVVGVFVQVEY